MGDSRRGSSGGHVGGAVLPALAGAFAATESGGVIYPAAATIIPRWWRLVEKNFPLLIFCNRFSFFTVIASPISLGESHIKNLFLCLSAFILLSTTAATTLRAEADQRIKKALDELDVKYVIDDDGDYAITIAYEAEGRSQLVYVVSETDSIKGFEIRDIFSYAVRDKAPTLEMTSDLMRTSNKSLIGAFEMTSCGNILYIAKIPANLPPKQLHGIIRAVAAYADDAEKEILGSDEL